MSETKSPKPRIIAIANQKGGVGKTTTAINLGAALAAAGHATLIIDADPQGNASTGLAVTRREISTYEVLNGERTIGEAKIQTSVPNLWIVPATRDLAGSEAELLTGAERPQYRLRDALGAFAISSSGQDFAYILIDCPPSLNVLTVNSLTAADSVLVPLQCEFFAMEGLTQLVRTTQLIRERGLNPALEIEGILLTMYDNRTRLSEDVATEVRSYAEQVKTRVFDAIIPRNVRIAEAPSHGKPAIIYDVQASGSQAYIALAREMIDAGKALAA